MTQLKSTDLKQHGFTILELLIVIVVIGILAAITIVSYNGIQNRAIETTMKSDLRNAATTLELENTTNGSYPESTELAVSGNNTLNYYPDSSGYCVDASNTRISSRLHIKIPGGQLLDGTCKATVTSLAAGYTGESSQTCAVASHRAYCWGSNYSGSFGNGQAYGSSNTPVAVSTTGVLNGKKVTAITSPAQDWLRYTCATASGQAYCWGENSSGQLGNNSTATTNVPVAVNISGVLAGKTVTAISAGMSHVCAVASGQAYCWGNGSLGQLGNNSTTGSYVPVAVSTAGVLAGKTVTAISAGTSHTCAVASGQIYCWGGGEYGRLGNGTSANTNVPVAVNTAGVLAGKTVTAVSANDSHTCAVASGQAYCWGSGSNGMLGNNATANANVPVAVSTTGVLASKTVTAISTGLYHTCAVASGQAYCWGNNGFGQLGNGGSTSSNVPVAVNTTGVLSGKTVTAIVAGGIHSCAVASGSAYCWGNNGSGQLGNGNTTSSNVPVEVRPIEL